MDMTSDEEAAAPKRGLVRAGLAQFGGAWLTGFGASFLVILVAALRFRPELFRVADLALTAGLSVLGLAWIAALALALTSRRSLSTRVIYGGLAVSLLLPLLWAPVLGAVAAAWIAGAPIEYSEVYAAFRIRVAELLFPAAQTLLHTDLIDAGWNVFQVVATLIGFIAATTQLWPMVVSFWRRLGEI